jgi:3'-phosphoadenosine 5'-phosphosulfate sulfotransferase (PAPS reductase)/FAD synthetase
MIRLVSMSGGKDSTACLLLALERHPKDEVRAVYADTGNEHELVDGYIEYLEKQTGISVHKIRPDFTDWWWRRRDYVRDKWPEKGVPDDVIKRVLAVMEKGPTGNPYLDLCIIKSRFPARRVQFCTQFLKTEPLTEYAMQLVDEHGAVESWQGVRGEESPSRAKQPEREDVGGGLTIYRPILRWKVEEVFAFHRKHGIEVNPLYRLGMNRVGCMPCINSSKDQILEISKRFPQHIDRIAEWEAIVSEASKRGNSTFIPAPGENDTAWERGNIRQVIRWSQTKRGGRLTDWIRQTDEPAACSSSYGLCE